MEALRWTALLLAVLLRAEGGSGSSSHSLRYFYTASSEPGQGLPSFVTAGYVDGQLFSHYHSHARRDIPAAPWAERLTEEDPQYWERNTQVFQGWEAIFRGNLRTLRERYNQSEGLHTWQFMCGCEVGEDGRRRGRWQYGYEGRDFISFDQDTLTWTAADPPAGITRRKWDADSAGNAYQKAYLEEECVDWLQKYLRLGKESLLRRERPVVKVTRKDGQDGLETLLCQAHGFYPKEIDIAWRKSGVDRQEDTFHGVVSPNVDGTYYTWLSIEVDPKERSLYQCRVEHDALEKPLDVNVEKSGFGWLTVVVVLVLVLVLVVLLVLALVYLKKRREKPKPDYGRASTSDEGSDSSTRASPPLRV